MSYNIRFKAKIDGTDQYITVYDPDANITWNLRDMIRASTGLEWENEADNGLCSEVIEKIEWGYTRLTYAPDVYKKYESDNGWGTIEGCAAFFYRILIAWRDFKRASPELARVATFWIE